MPATGCDWHFVMLCDTVGCDKHDESVLHLDIHELNKDMYGWMCFGF